MPYNATTRVQYQGANIERLAGSKRAKGYSSDEWATFLQWKQAGFMVKKGEKATTCVTFGETSKVNKAGKVVASSYARGFCLFNRDQVAPIVQIVNAGEGVAVR